MWKEVEQIAPPRSARLNDLDRAQVSAPGDPAMAVQGLSGGLRLIRHRKSASSLAGARRGGLSQPEGLVDDAVGGHP